MLNLLRARFTVPVLHALLFVTTSVLMWISSKPILDGPARLPFGILWVADLPISAIAFSVMFTSAEYGWFAWAVWGVVGTVWWYFLSRSMETLQRRFSSKPEK
ncbi:MAG: hypothetical protein DMG44_15220 [Acidobacteria bacterium]|nr:MAG: hypothetical protein DMG44_15220 [Acidobacteriota bacterium]